VSSCLYFSPGTFSLRNGLVIASLATIEPLVMCVCRVLVLAYDVGGRPASIVEAVRDDVNRP